MSKVTKKQLQYDVEALVDEVEHWQEVAAEAKGKLWEVITENDRLTLTYEPYRPPGDEHEGLQFYDILEENDELTRGILDKMEVIAEQDQRIAEFVRDNLELRNQVWELQRTLQVNPEIKAKKEYKPKIKNERWWNFSIELWPGAWGLSYYRYQWRKYGGTSREGNFQIGPFGFSWNREPKRA